jgi:pimeloyl-ACP methyl ester carboxylesterase
VIENAFDAAHFNPVHSVCNTPRLRPLPSRGGEFAVTGVFEIPPSDWQKAKHDEHTVKAPFTAVAYSPGLVVSEFGGEHVLPEVHGGMMELLAPGSEGLAARTTSSDGKVVLWVHGYTRDASVWEDVWKSLPGFQHIGVELPGHGASHPLKEGEDLAGLAKRVASFALAHGVGHLVGLSFGGMVALQAAAERPEAFRTLILAAPALGGGPQDPETMTCNLELLRLYKERGAGPWLRERWMSCPPEVFEGAATQPELFTKLKSVVGRHSWQELGCLAIPALVNYPQLTGKLKAIKSSTLILIGDNDMDAFKRSAALIH